MRLTLLLITVTLVLFCSKVLASDGTFRVSGIVGQEGLWLFAVIEDKTGNCRVYTKGDTLGNWPIIDVITQGVIVDAGGETRLLRLEGSSFIDSSAKAGAEDGNMPPNISSTRPTQGKLSQQEMQLAFNNIANELERNNQKAVEPQLLNAILGFSPQTVIKAINEKPVKSIREAVNIMQGALNNNVPVDFTLSEGNEITKIYYRFSESTAPHPHE